MTTNEKLALIIRIVRDEFDDPWYQDHKEWMRFTARVEELLNLSDRELKELKDAKD